MNKEFIPYEQALELKELGFDEPCAAKYSKGSFQNNSLGTWNDYNDSTWGLSLISAPLYQQAFRWFREKYGMYNHVELFSDGEFELFTYSIRYGYNLVEDDYGTHEEAELACLKKLIEILKNK